MAQIADAERTKYEQCWSLPDYHGHSPGKVLADYFIDVVAPKDGAKILDAGCGAGEGGAALAEKGFDVTYMDLARFTDKEPFIEASLWRLRGVPGYWDHGYCCDVMEHIPEQFIMLAAQELLNHCEGVFFHISFLPDHFGKMIGEPLHLTVKPFTWWRDALREIGTVVEARDRMVEGAFYVES